MDEYDDEADSIEKHTQLMMRLMERDRHWKSEHEIMTLDYRCALIEARLAYVERDCFLSEARGDLEMAKELGEYLNEQKETLENLRAYRRNLDN